MVKDPAITVRSEHAAYSFDEDDAAATVVFVARTAPGLPRPNVGVDFSVSSVGRTDGAGSPGDYAAVSTVFAFEPGDFTASGSEWEARKEVALSIVDDGETERRQAFPGWTPGSPAPALSASRATPDRGAGPERWA